MRQLTYSVIADGGTDRALVPIITWAILQLDPTVQLLEPRFAKRTGPVAMPDDNAMLVFIHRDAENQTRQDRLEEFAEIRAEHVVPVIPVRMTEAWLLSDPDAITEAADRPSATVELPTKKQWEQVANPKTVLEEALLDASGYTGRKRARFKRDLVSRRVLVAQLTKSFSGLVGLPSFDAFREDLASAYPFATDR